MSFDIDIKQIFEELVSFSKFEFGDKVFLF